MKTFYFLLFFVAVILLLAAMGMTYQATEHVASIKRWSFGAIYVFSMIYAIAATSLMLPRDLEDRTLYTILSKPVPRFEYLLGRLLGVISVIGTSMLVMFLLMCVLIMMKMGAIEEEFLHNLQMAKPRRNAAAARSSERHCRSEDAWCDPKPFLGAVGLFHQGMRCLFLLRS